MKYRELIIVSQYRTHKSVSASLNVLIKENKYRLIDHKTLQTQ